MITDLAPERQGALLEGLFTAHIKASLEKAAIDAIRPAIREAVDRAVAELEPHVQAYVDPMKREMVVRLVTHEVKA